MGSLRQLSHAKNSGDQTLNVVDDINHRLPLKIKAVVFDIGGVLIEINRDWQFAMRDAGLRSPVHGELSAFWAFDDFQLAAIPKEQYFEALQLFLAVHSPDEAILAHKHIIKEAYPGTLELIEELKDAGITVACLSNTNEPHWDEMRSGRFPNIDAMQDSFVSHELKLEKPHFPIFQAVEDKTALLPAEILFFDDTEKNIDGALEKGWKAYWIDHTQNPAEQMELILISEGVLRAP
jgi:HAD superfamily hydrolase (TIGR01509 family)